MKPRVSALLAGSALSMLVGCGEAGDSLEVTAVAGETVSVELGGDASAAVLPEGAMIANGRLTWTPTAEQIGEHALALDVSGVDEARPLELVILVGEADDAEPISYGGCECGSRPRPPKPRGDAASALFAIAAWSWRRRSAHRAA